MCATNISKPIHKSKIITIFIARKLQLEGLYYYVWSILISTSLSNWVDQGWWGIPTKNKQLGGSRGEWQNWHQVNHCWLRGSRCGKDYLSFILLNTYQNWDQCICVFVHLLIQAPTNTDKNTEKERRRHPNKMMYNVSSCSYVYLQHICLWANKITAWVCSHVPIQQLRCSNTLYVWHGCGMQCERFYSLNHFVGASFPHLHHLEFQPTLPNLGKRQAMSFSQFQLAPAYQNWIYQG